MIPLRIQSPHPTHTPSIPLPAVGDSRLRAPAHRRLQGRRGRGEGRDARSSLDPGKHGTRARMSICTATCACCLEIQPSDAAIKAAEAERRRPRQRQRSPLGLCRLQTRAPEGLSRRRDSSFSFGFFLFELTQLAARHGGHGPHDLLVLQCPRLFDRLPVWWDRDSCGAVYIYDIYI